jgi:hypothetical protein
MRYSCGILPKLRKNPSLTGYVVKSLEKAFYRGGSPDGIVVTQNILKIY